MAKYELLPQQLLLEGTITPAQIHAPEPMDAYWILRTCDAAYWERLKTMQLTRQEIRRIGFPVDAGFVLRECIINQGTYDAAVLALQYGVALNTAGGTHHAFADYGEGFCMLNDIALAANRLLDERKAKQILVIDLDVHQGNGTARLMQGEPRVFTFSAHGADNFPARKEKSDLDIGLPTGTTDGTYLQMVAETVPRLIETVRPDFVFYLAGVDVLATDALGKLALSREGCRERDELVLGLCHAKSLPVAVCMGGGYSKRMADIVEAHANTHRVAAMLFD